MQTYSKLGFGTSSVLPSVKHTQQIQTQAKPYASLASHDTVHFGSKEKQRRDNLKAQCIAHGLTEDEVKAIEQRASTDSNVVNSNRTNKTTKRYQVEINLYKQKLEEIYRNVDGIYDAIGEVD